MLRMFPKVPTSPVRRVSTPEMRNLNRSSISDSSPGLPHLTTISAEQEKYYELNTNDAAQLNMWVHAGGGGHFGIYCTLALCTISLSP